MRQDDRNGLEPMTAREVILEIRAVMQARGHTLNAIDADAAVEHPPPRPGGMAGGLPISAARSKG